MSFELGIIGAGNMGYAVAEGAIKSDAIPGSSVMASDPFRLAEKEAKWKALGITCTRDNTEVIRKCKMVVLSVKPQLLCEVSDMLSVMTAKQTVISVIAGISNEKLKAMCGSANVVRVMLNTPCLIGAGAVSICPHVKTPEDIVASVERIFIATSGCMERVPERCMDGITALAGSGVAFVYQFIEALADGGVNAGIPRVLATKLAAQTVLGGAKMVLETKQHPGALKDAVSSPAGTTIAGIRAAERGGLRSATIEAVTAAAERSRELAKIDTDNKTV